VKGGMLLSDCGPHCRTRIKKRRGIPVQTLEIVHCKKRKCQLCHNKPR
jgi:hypothetical protein